MWRAVVASASALAALSLAAFGAFSASQAPANQLWGTTIVNGPPGEHRVALTFDDGPNPPYTDRILDVLRREHVRATFFLVGDAVARDPAAARRIAAGGNAIGNHSWDHAHLLAMGPAGVRSEIERAQAAIQRATGVRTTLFRPPFGQRDGTVLGAARQLGYDVVMWSIPLPNDWERPGAATIARRVLDRAGDGDIIVLHDGNRGSACETAEVACDRSQDVTATETIVRGLRARGFSFVTIPELNVPAAITRNDGRRVR